MSTYSTEGIVLKRSNLGESNLLLKLYTKKFGKIEAVARSAKKSKGKLKGCLEPSLYCDFIFAHGRKIDTITNSFILDSFLNSRLDYEKTLISMAIVDIVDKMTIEGYTDEKIFDLLKKTLQFLDEKGGLKRSNMLLLLLFFEINLLYFTGFRPHMEKCVFCGKNISLEGNKFSFSLGGILHTSCCGNCPDAISVESNDIKLIKFLEIKEEGLKNYRKEIDEKLNMIFKLQIEEDLVFRNIFLLRDFIVFNLDKNIKSLDVVYSFK